jgi:hypothetical protein
VAFVVVTNRTARRQLHIKEDERHGRQMLDEVALPLVDM